MFENLTGIRDDLHRGLCLSVCLSDSLCPSLCLTLTFHYVSEIQMIMGCLESGACDARNFGIQEFKGVWVAAGWWDPNHPDEISGSALLVHGQVIIIFVVSVCLFVCAVFLSRL